MAGKNAAKKTDEKAHEQPRERGGTAMIAVALAILSIALIQAITPTTPDAYWDIDPRSQFADHGRLIITSITPAVLSMMQCAMLVLAAIGMALHVKGRGKLCLTSTTLALLGMAFAAYHIMRGGPHVQAGSQWLSAAAGALALFHLAQREAVRRWLLGAMVAMLLPLSLKAIWFVYGEHADTIKMFMADKERFLAEHGWTVDSPNAQIFIRRMLDPEASGAYGLSNVFGSVIASLTAMAFTILVGLFCRAKKAPSSSRWAAVIAMAIATGPGIFTTYLSRSKGAGAALLMAMGIVVVWALLHAWLGEVDAKPQAVEGAVPRARGRWGVVGGVAALALIAGATGAIVARGHLSPPTATGGERSLFFRYQYLVGALHYVKESPPAVVAKGVGPAGFQAVYQRVKDPLNPEEVMSTHDTLVDYAAMLGVGGAAWGLLLLGWIWAAGRGAGEAITRLRFQYEDSSRPSAVAQGELVGAGLLTAFIFVTQYRVQIDMLMPSNAAIWLICMGAYLLATMILAAHTGWLAKLGGGWVALSAFVGALVLLVHGQIEMTFFNIGGSVIAWLVVAVAGGAGVAMVRERAETQRDPAQPVSEPAPAAAGGAPTVVVFAAGLIIAGAFAAWPMRKTIAVQSHLAEASARLRAGDLQRTVTELEAATSIDPGDADVWRSWSTQRWMLAEAMRHDGQADAANKMIDESIATLEKVVSPTGPLPDEGKLLRGIAELIEQVQTDRPEAERLVHATTVHERLALVVNPYAIEERLRYARLLDKRGLKNEARGAYEQTLKLNGEAYLDPAKQLNASDRGAIEQRVRELN